MTGERDLEQLQRRMAPQLHEGTYVYCTFPSFSVPPDMSPICTFREAEGTTAIVEKCQAERVGAAFEFESRLITLTVHSALDAVGFLAGVTACLAAVQISCNVVAAYHHDHLFVPVHRADEAMARLTALAKPKAQGGA